MKIRRLLLDGDLLLEVLLARDEGHEAVARLWARVELGAAEGLLAAHAVPALHAVARRARGGVFAQRMLRELLRVFGVAPLDGDVIGHALEAAGHDLELALLLATAQATRCHAVVTRRPADSPLAAVACLTPEQALAALG